MYTDTTHILYTCIIYLCYLSRITLSNDYDLTVADIILYLTATHTDPSVYVTEKSVLSLLCLSVKL